MKKNYRKLEDKVIDIFKENKKFVWNNIEFQVENVGKPKAQSSGEPKTDVYIRLLNIKNKIEVEYKLSCKLEGTNEFQENKIKKERALQIFGEDWSSIISNAALSIKDKFENTEVYFPLGTGRTKETQYTNGWKVEIASKSRELAVPLNLSDTDIRNKIYRGTTLDKNKRDCYVNEELVVGSGVADYMLVSLPEKIEFPNDVLDSIINIDEYPIDQHYMIFTGNNLRVLKNKYDGNRPLGVQVIWSADLTNNRLVKKIKFDKPLEEEYSGKKIAEHTNKEIEKLGVNFKSKMI